jgi:hypothetical protein
MNPGDVVSIARYHNGIRMDDPPITGLLVEHCPLMPYDSFKRSFRIKILETTGELMELIVDNRDVAEVLIGA